MTTPTDTAKLADEIEALAKKIERAKANPPEPSYHIDGGERSRAFDSYVFGLMADAISHLPTIIAALRELEAVKAREAKLREALEPFAARTRASSLSEETMIRRARAALGAAG